MSDASATVKRQSRSRRTAWQAAVWQAAVIAAIFVSGCTQPRDREVTDVVGHAFVAYRDGDDEALASDIETLSALIYAEAERRASAYDAVARLRSLRALLRHDPPFDAHTRLVYAIYVCARVSWADGVAPSEEDDRSYLEGYFHNEALGCEGATRVLVRWGYSLMLRAPFTHYSKKGRAYRRLVELGFLHPSPHRVAGFWPYGGVKIQPLTPYEPR